MNNSNIAINNRYQVSYYFTNKEWGNQIGLQYWPGYVCLIAAGLFGLVLRPSDLIIICLLLVSVLGILFCAFVTRFYANSILEITENGLIITKNKNKEQFYWSDIENIVFMVPAHGASYLEIVMAVFGKNNVVNYIIIESLYFKKANIKAREIGCLIEKYFESYTFKMHRSTFYSPIMLKNKDILPTIYP